MKVNYIYVIGFVVIIMTIAYFIFPDDKQLGIIYKKSFYYEQAITKLENALQANPQSRHVLTNLEELYRIAGESEKQVHILKKLAALFPNNLVYYKTLAKIYEWRGEFKEAVPYYHYLYTHADDKEEYFQHLKSLYFYSKESQALIALIRNWIENNPHDTAAYNELLYLYTITADMQQLEKLYHDRLKFNPRNRSLVLKIAELYTFRGATNAIAPLFNTFLDHDSATIEDYDAIAQFCSWNQLSDLELTVLEKKAVQFPMHANVFVDLGKWYTAHQQKKKAIAAYEKHLSLYPDDHLVRKDLAHVYAWADQRDKEIAALEYLYPIYKSDKKFLMNLAQRYEWNAQREKALEIFGTVYKLLSQSIHSWNCDDVDIILQIAQHYEWAGNQIEAISLYEKISTPGIHVCEKLYQNLQYHLHLAQLYEWNGLYERALRMYELFSSQKCSLEIELRLIDLYGQLGYAEKRIHRLKTIVQNKNLENPDKYIELLAQSLVQIDKKSDAIIWYKELYRANPSNKEILYTIAQLYQWSDNSDSAVMYYEKILANGKPDEEIVSVVSEYYFWNKEYEKALFYFQMLRKISPQRSLVSYFIGESLFQQKKTKYAKKHFLEAFHHLSQKKRTDFEQDAYLAVCFRLGRYSLLAQEIIALDPESKLSIEYFAQTLYNLLNNNDYSNALLLLRFAENNNVQLDNETSQIIKNHIAVLENNGRWDIAHRFIAYVR